MDLRVGLGLATVQTPAATHYSFSDPKGPSTRHFEIFSSVLTMILRKWKCITNFHIPMVMLLDQFYFCVVGV